MSQDSQYEEVVSTFGAAIERLSRSYEADPDKRRDLLQDIHFALWRSLAAFGRQCSLRTWVYRVAHNVAISHVLKSRRNQHPLESLEDVEDLSGPPGTADPVERRINLDRLYRLIQNLKPVDRQLILLYLEGLDASSIAEITGISAANVATTHETCETRDSREADRRRLLQGLGDAFLNAKPNEVRAAIAGIFPDGTMCFTDIVLR